MQNQESQQLYFDVHNHLLDYTESELSMALSHAHKNKLKYISTNTTHQADYLPQELLCKKYAASFPKLLPSFGIHPCFIHHEFENKDYLKNLEEILGRDGGYGLGEIGLDFRKVEMQKNPKEQQMKFFIEQLELGFRMDRVVTVHCVRAHGEMLKIFKKYNKMFTKQSLQNSQFSNYNYNPILLHSYGGSTEITQSLLKLSNLNFYFSLSLKRKDDLLKVIPLDRLLLETDAPHQVDLDLIKQEKNDFDQVQQKLVLEGHRNLSGMIGVNGYLAKYYDVSKEEFFKRVYRNSLKVFKMLH